MGVSGEGGGQGGLASQFGGSAEIGDGGRRAYRVGAEGLPVRNWVCDSLCSIFLSALTNAFSSSFISLILIIHILYLPVNGFFTEDGKNVLFTKQVVSSITEVGVVPVQVLIHKSPLLWVRRVPVIISLECVGKVFYDCVTLS